MRAGRSDLPVSRRERLAAERNAERRFWPVLRLPVHDAVRAALCAAVALALLTEEKAATALGAVLAALIWALLSIGEQVLRRDRSVRLGEPVRLEAARVRWADATARGNGRAPATPSRGVPVAPSIGGKVPRQRR